MAARVVLVAVAFVRVVFVAVVFVAVVFAEAFVAVAFFAVVFFAVVFRAARLRVVGPLARFSASRLEGPLLGQAPPARRPCAASRWSRRR